jgi:hypothetical protein
LSAILSKSSKEFIHAWCCSASGEACASGKVVLCWFGAVEASRLAPSKEACGLAILESIIGSGIVALAAGGRDAEIRLHAACELIVVDASQTKSLLGASILLLANSLGIGESGLIICRAATCGFKAWCCSASGKACASGKVVLRWFGAVKAS